MLAFRPLTVYGNRSIWGNADGVFSNVVTLLLTCPRLRRVAFALLLLRVLRSKRLGPTNLNYFRLSSLALGRSAERRLVEVIQSALLMADGA